MCCSVIVREARRCLVLCERSDINLASLSAVKSKHRFLSCQSLRSPASHSGCLLGAKAAAHAIIVLTNPADETQASQTAPHFRPISSLRRSGFMYLRSAAKKEKPSKALSRSAASRALAVYEIVQLVVQFADADGRDKWKQRSDARKHRAVCKLWRIVVDREAMHSVELYKRETISCKTGVTLDSTIMKMPNLAKLVKQANVFFWRPVRLRHLPQVSALQGLSYIQGLKLQNLNNLAYFHARGHLQMPQISQLEVYVDGDDPQLKQEVSALSASLHCIVHLRIDGHDWAHPSPQSHDMRSLPWPCAERLRCWTLTCYVSRSDISHVSRIWSPEAAI